MVSLEYFDALHLSPSSELLNRSDVPVLFVVIDR